MIPPLIVENYLNCEIEISIIAGKRSTSTPTFFSSIFSPPVPTTGNVKMLSKNVKQSNSERSNDQKVFFLESGEKKSILNFHSLQRLNFQVRLKNKNIHDSNEIDNENNNENNNENYDKNENNYENLESVWSTPAIAKECSSRTCFSEVTLSVDVMFRNGSVLTVLLDIKETEGSRVCTFYVPYWIVSSSFLSLKYQHDANYVSSTSNTTSFSGSDKNSNININGIDNLAPDQYYKKKKNFSFFDNFFGFKTDYNETPFNKSKKNEIKNENNNNEIISNSNNNNNNNNSTTGSQDNFANIRLSQREIQNLHGKGGRVPGSENQTRGLAGILNKKYNFKINFKI